MKIECPNSYCRSLVEVPPSHSGDQIKCPNCGRKIPVPTADDRTVVDSAYTEHDPLVGETLAHYQVLEKVGEGGMGAVYRARNLSLNKVIALKVLPEVLTRRDPKFVERFQREARAAAQLDHPNVVPVHFVGSDKGHHFLEMAYVKGRTLGRVFKNGERLGLPEIVRIITEAARGLSAAHKRGVIHRDIKPDNIMIDSDGRVMISDFGLAKTLSEDTGITVSGQIVGTPFYMSPEQCDGKEADTRSDIYALGVVFFEGVTGKRPFDGKTLLSVMYQHKNQAMPSPRSLNPRVPDSICRIIARMTAKNPINRYQTCEDLLRDLERAKTQSRMRLVGRLARFVASLIVVGAAVAMLYCIVNPPEVQETMKRALQQIKARSATPAPTPQPKPTPTPSAKKHSRAAPAPTAKRPSGKSGTAGAPIAISPIPPEPVTVDRPPVPAPQPAPIAPPPQPDVPKRAPLSPDAAKPPEQPAPQASGGMLLIPAGECQIGDEGVPNAKPKRSVTLDAFLMDAHEVTNNDYLKFIAATGHPPPPYWQNSACPPDKGNHPVTCVNWGDATAYAQWAGKRLPTEAEWEKASSWDDSKKTKRTYPWGSEFDRTRCNAIYALGCPEDDVQRWTAVWLFGGARRAICDVGGNTVPADAPDDVTSLGIRGMGGNVSEWCADWFQPSYYASAPSRNPAGPEFGKFRAVRGGNWFSPKEGCRTAGRQGVAPSTKSSLIGFRCAKDAPRP